MKRYIKSSYEKNPKIYTEYNEKGEYIRQSEDAEMLIQDALEFGGCVVDDDNLFVGGYEWVYNTVLIDIFQDGGISPDYDRFHYFSEEERINHTTDDRYTPSATAGDYSPSSPWNAPGMSVRDFI